MTTAARTPTPPSARAAQFKGLADWIEIFRSGTHTDSKGRQKTFTNAELDEMVANHTVGAAPAVLGHPKHDDPAYAWTAELKREGDSLFAKFTDINADFEAGVASGAYRNRSVSVFPDPEHGWRVQHVGWLGAARPAISGLKPVEFSADQDAMEFSSPETDAVQELAWAADSTARLLRGLRDHLIEQSGLDQADKVLPAWQIDSLVVSAQRATEFLRADPAATPLFSSTPGDDMTITKEQLDAAVAAAREEGKTSGRAELETQFSAQGAELSELRALRQKETIQAEIDKWAKAGIVKPALHPGLAEFMAAISADGSFNFSAAAGGAQVGKTPAEWFSEFVSALKPQVGLGGRQAVGDEPELLNQNDANAISARAQQYVADEAKAGRTVSIELAVEHVQRVAASS